MVRREFSGSNVFLCARTTCILSVFTLVSACIDNKAGAGGAAGTGGSMPEVDAGMAGGAGGSGMGGTGGMVPPGQPVGAACASDIDCLQGFCVDGVCCLSGCHGTCMACNVAGKEGTCSPLPKSSVDPNASIPCNTPSQCDGVGKCLANAAKPCTVAADCASGFCSDGYCCDSACDQPCMSCKISGKEGTCSPTPVNSQDSNSTPICVGPFSWCNGSGLCVDVLGQTCTDGANCMSGHCVDGVCCDSACTDTCKTCDLPGSEGTCSYVSAYDSDPVATSPCNAPQSSCNGSGECKDGVGVACTMHTQCVSGFCSNGTCQPPPMLTGPLQWLWANDQTVCKDPNGFGSFKDDYPSVNVAQIVARDDESVFGVGTYRLPSQGLGSLYGDYLGTGEIRREGPHTFKLNVASGGASASWSPVDFYHMSIEPLKVCQSGPWKGTKLLGPFIEPVGGDIAFYRKNLDVYICVTTTSWCKLGELSKYATPQWSLGTTEVCAHDEIVFTGDPTGNIVTREDDRLKKYDPSGTVVLDVLQPLGFAASTLGLAATGDIHGAAQSATAVSLGRTSPSGMLAWTKTFSNVAQSGVSKQIDLAVDASGNSIIAFYAYDAMDLGNGPIPRIGVKDLMLAKYNVQGNLIWAKRLGSGNFSPLDFEMRKTGTDEIALLVHFTGLVDLGDGLLQSSPVLVKYNAAGNLVWRADLLPLYPATAPEVLSVAISGHPSGAVFVTGTGYGEASAMPTPNCNLGANNLPGTYPRPLRMFTAKYGP